MPVEPRTTQREKLTVAVATALSARGRAGLTVADVVREAAVSRRTFYEHFESLQEAVLATHRYAGEALLRLISEGCTTTDAEEWAAQLRAGLTVTLDFAAAKPELLRLLAADPFVFDPRRGEEILAVRERFAELLRGGRQLRPGVQIPELTEEFLIAAVANAITLRILNDELDRIATLESPLLELILVHYAGREEARRIVVQGA